MKPDLGSVFVRAVLRAAGTTLGVVIGAAMLFVLPKGPLLVACIALLALALPWAKRVSYGVQALVLTPLVIVLLDLIAPMPQTVDYGGQRLADTVLGAAIVLVLGYFIWPRRHGGTIAAQYAAAMAAIADYLVAACGPAVPGAPDDPARAARWIAYARLSDLRAVLGRSMGEPPPAGREAADWFPAVAAAERLCDRITARAASAPGPLPADAVRAVADRLRNLGRPRRPDSETSVHDAFLASIADEAARIADRLDSLGEPGTTERKRRSPGETGTARPMKSQG
jgi:uncharacterized membrane protein YccC